MKLRIRGNSVRLRLGQSEVRYLAESGALDESIQFDIAGNQRLEYGLEVATGASEVSASFEAGKLLVRLPSDLVRRWAASDLVTIEALQVIAGGGSLKILVEKDFECIDGPPDEPQDDAFPHPRNESPCAPGDGLRSFPKQLP
jgi:uncharacterized protein DUF7009